MNKIYFEVKGEALLDSLGVTKSEFARRMGIQRQNVKALFKSKNLEVIRKASDVLDVPFEMLVGYVNPIDIDSRQFSNLDESRSNDYIEPEDIPDGETTEDRRKRQAIIVDFYRQWRNMHPDSKVFNNSLSDWINIRHISVEETAGKASLTYLSTLAVLQLDAILRLSKPVSEGPSKPGTRNQSAFEKMLIMRHYLQGIGEVRLTVGVKRSDKTKVQYCITAIEAQTKKQSN